MYFGGLERPLLRFRVWEKKGKEYRSIRKCIHKSYKQGNCSNLKVSGIITTWLWHNCLVGCLKGFVLPRSSSNLYNILSYFIRILRVLFLKI